MLTAKTQLVLDLFGYFAVPAAIGTLSEANVTFGAQLVGTNSPPRTVTLTNTGELTLDIASVSITGTNAGDLRKGFGLFWTWRIRRGKPGRPRVPQPVRDLIRMMSRNKPALGCTAHSRRVAETGYRDYPTHRRQIHGATSKTPLTNLADVP
jgi:hypothetical protein